MGNIIISYIAGIASLVALFVSVYNSSMEKRRLVTEVITKNRIEWIVNVRNLLAQFISCYQYSKHDEMCIIRGQVALYMNYINPQYVKLLAALEVCTEDRVFSQKNIDEVIIASQNVLCGVWTRMKREAGVKCKSEAVLHKKVKQELTRANLY